MTGTKPSSRRAAPRDGSASCKLVPRQVLAVTLLFFLVIHTILVQRTLHRHANSHEPQSTRTLQSSQHHHHDWHVHWKMPPRQSPSSTAKDKPSSLTTSVTANAEPQTTPIRSWGANLTTTPLIFVHIGKAGGGTIRARFAAARPNFAAAHWRTPDPDAVYEVAVHDSSTTTTTPVSTR